MLNEALIMSVEPQALTLKYRNEYLYLKDSILFFIFDGNFDNLVMKQANFLGMYLEGALGHDTNISPMSINTTLPFVANLDPNKSKFRNGKTITLAVSRKYQHAQGYETYWYLFIYIDIDTQALTNRSKNSFARMHLEFYPDVQNKHFKHSNQYTKVVSNPVWLDKRIDSVKFTKTLKMLINDGIINNKQNQKILGVINISDTTNTSNTSSSPPVNRDSVFFGVDFTDNNALKEAFANSVFKPKLRDLWIEYISEDDMFTFWSVSKQDYINDFDITSKVIADRFCLTFSIHTNSMYEIALIFDYDSNQKKASLTFGILLNNIVVHQVPYRVYLKSEAITANINEIPYLFSDRYLQMSVLESYYRLLQTKLINDAGNFDMSIDTIKTLQARNYFYPIERELQDDILFLLVRDLPEFKVLHYKTEMVTNNLYFKFQLALMSDITVNKVLTVAYTFQIYPLALRNNVDCVFWLESTKLTSESVLTNDNEGFAHAMLKAAQDIVENSNNAIISKVATALKPLIPEESNTTDNKTILDVLPVESNRSMTSLALLGVLNEKLWNPNNYVDTLGALNFQSLDYDVTNNDAEFVFNFGNSNNKLNVYIYAFDSTNVPYYLTILINGQSDSFIIMRIDTTYPNSGKAIKDALTDFLESPNNLSKLTEGLNTLIRSQALDLPQNTKTVGQIINELKSKLQNTWSNKVSSLDYLSNYRSFYDLKIMSYDNRSLEINSPITDFLNNSNLPLRLSFGNQSYSLQYILTFEKLNQDIKCKVELVMFYDPSDAGRAEYTDTYTKIYERSIDMTNSDNWLQLIYFAITSTLSDLLNDSAFDRI